MTSAVCSPVSGETCNAAQEAMQPSADLRLAEKGLTLIPGNAAAKAPHNGMKYAGSSNANVLNSGQAVLAVKV